MNGEKTAEGLSGASEAPRPGCILCVKKHLGQAAVLFQEALQGYPAHRWLAIGHLAEAEAESQELDSDFADEIRQERKKAEVGDYIPDCTDLLVKCGELDGSEMEYEATALRVASRFMAADYSYFINPSQTNTTRYVVLDNGVFYTGRVGIKKGESYIKFVAEPVRSQGKYRSLFERGALKEMSRNKFLDAIEDETYFTNIDVKRLYQS